MLTVHPEHGPFAWWLSRELSGQDLRRHYAAPQDMPPRLLGCVGKFGEGDQSHEALSPSAPSLLSKLDTIEGKQLLRACRTRLRALSYLQRLGSSA